MQLIDNNFSVKLGGNIYVNVPILIAFDNAQLFTLSRLNDGYLGIDFEVYNDSGKKIASVKRNNIYFGDKKSYKLDGDADHLALSSTDSGVILVEIRKRAAAAPVELDVSVRSYLPSGKLMDLGPNMSNLGGLRMIGNVFQGCRIGISISSDGSVGLCSG